MRGVNGGMQILQSVMIYQPNLSLKFRPESEIQAKIIILITHKVQNPGSENGWIHNPLQFQDPEIR